MYFGPPQSGPHASAAASPQATARVDGEMPTLFLIDDDKVALRDLERTLAANGFRTEAFGSAEEFLAAHSPGRPGCLIISSLPIGALSRGLSAKLPLCDKPIPIIFLAAQPDVSMVVELMRAGAVDVLVKPVKTEVLVERARAALKQNSAAWRRQVLRAKFAARLSRLTPRQQGVMKLVVAGMPNKQIAARMNISLKTVECHRAHVMKRLGVRNLVELVRAVVGNTAFA